MMSEGYADLDVVMRFYGTKSEPASHFPFNFLFIDSVHRSSDANHIKNKIESWYSKMPEHGWANWVVSRSTRNQIRV